MKRLLLGFCAAVLIGAAAAQSVPKGSPLAFRLRQEDRKLVTNQPLNNEPANFQFAIVSDRTGGHRARVFSKAVQQLNLLQPEFVVSVGDLIEGYTTDKERLTREWLEFQGYVSQLQMPFFYVPGNHDITNVTMEKLWQEKFGRRYYDFVYHNVLFLLLNSEDPPDKEAGHISEEQRAFIQRSLAAHRDVTWTLVFLHKPIWAHSDADKSGWPEVEKLLDGRPYTVFAGHYHRYQKYVRQGQNYYQLATTGGASKIRGTDYGEFDHLVWVTMKKDGPVLANILLDGIVPEDLGRIETGEEGHPAYYRKPTHAVRGTVVYRGQPAAGAQVVFQSVAKETGAPRADAITGADGTFVLSTYRAHDGAPAGEYTVTIVLRQPRYDAAGKPGRNQLPARYAKADTSGLRATIKSGTNDLTFPLQD